MRSRTRWFISMHMKNCKTCIDFSAHNHNIDTPIDTTSPRNIVAPVLTYASPRSYAAPQANGPPQPEKAKHLHIASRCNAMLSQHQQTRGYIFSHSLADLNS